MLATPPSWTPFHFHKTRLNFRSSAISSKFQRSRRRRPPPRTNNLEEQEEEEEFGSMGRVLVTSIKSTPTRRVEPVQIQPNPNSRSRSREKKKEEEEEEQSAAALRGSDVLWALQRAAKEKSRSRSKKKVKKVERRNEGEGRDEERVDYGDVKELNVKSDWEVRLNDLEIRLQQLLHSF